jgi:2-polyprenyl-6-methoxyphenol hydroxylase-like FAD-dependent oxidoreductase
LTRLTAKHFDLAVIGGGPAGAALAILMAKRGGRVALIEKSGYGLFRPGEHLPPQARGALTALGATQADLADCACDSAGILSDWGAALPLFKRYPGGLEGLGLNLDRARFDAALFALAGRNGAVCLGRTRLVAAEWLKSLWHLSLANADGAIELTADVVADASGRAAAFARRCNVGWRTAGDLTGAVAVMPPLAEPPPGRPLFVIACETGWWSATPAPSGSTIATWYGHTAERRSAGLDVASWWQQARDQSDDMQALVGLSAPPAVTAFPAFPRLMQPMQGPGWLAVGDAAACHDPLSGHGILYAFESAFRAAEMLAADVAMSKMGPIYEEAITSRFVHHMSLRKEAYGEAAHRFPGALFWRTMQAPIDFAVVARKTDLLSNSS